MVHGGMPELFLGLAYNGTTGRLSVQVIKGSNFKNLAMSRAPGQSGCSRALSFVIRKLYFDMAAPTQTHTCSVKTKKNEPKRQKSKERTIQQYCRRQLTPFLTVFRPNYTAVIRNYCYVTVACLTSALS